MVKFAGENYVQPFNIFIKNSVKYKYIKNNSKL